jgi:hypothetical protein
VKQMAKDDAAAESAGDVSNPREVQGTVALITVGGFMGVAGAAAIAVVVRGGDPTPILNIIAPLAFGVVAFYFGAKKSEAAT